MALILSILVLTLSAGVGASVPESVGKADTDVTQKDGCCCGCCADDGDATQNDDGDSCHKGCPFCITNSCPGFAAVLFTDQVRSLSEGDSMDSEFIPRRYVPPFVNGIWQPPWSV